MSPIRRTEPPRHTWTNSLKGKTRRTPGRRPTKFELLINLKTAKQIGGAIPQRVLTSADKVIK